MHAVISFFHILDYSQYFYSSRLTTFPAMRQFLTRMLFIFVESINAFNVLATNPSNCQRLSTINYHYSSPYHLPELDSDSDPSGMTFNFSIRAFSDGHLRLTSSPDAKQSAVTLEIIIGAGGNTFSAVRRKPKKSTSDYSINTYNILSDKEFRSFTLTLREEVLALYANNSDVPLMYYEDTSVTEMEYLSFGAWNNVAVEWAFDCRETEVLEPPITDPFLRLKRKYIRGDTVSPPVLYNSTLMINVAMDIIHAHLDVKTSQFSLRMMLDQKWTDQRTQWNPEEYGNISNLNFEYRAIWFPFLELLDLPRPSRSFLLNGWKLRLNNDGSVRFHSEANVETWCDVDVTNWPLDTHVCEVRIGLYLDQDYVGIETSSVRQELDTGSSEWEILSITSSTVKDDGTSIPQSFKLRITLKRLGGSYVMLFVVPLFVAFIMLISSFIIAPQHKTRLALVSASVLTLHLLLYMEDTLLPAHPGSSPRIMKTTSCLQITAMLQLIFHCFNIQIANFEISPPQFVKTVAKKPWMKHIHQVTYEVFSSDGKQDVDQTETLVNEDEVLNGGESPEGVNMNKYHWALISRCLDMLNFSLSFLILPFLLAPI